MIYYISIKKNINVDDFAKIIIKKIIRLHDIFDFIIFDRNFIFTFKYWNVLCYALKITRIFFTIFHFQIDDQIERQNNIIKQYFRIYVNFEQNDWMQYLFMTKFVYNNVMNTFIDILFFVIIQNYFFRICFENKHDFKIKFISTIEHAKKLKTLMIIFKFNFQNV